MKKKVDRTWDDQVFSSRIEMLIVKFTSGHANDKEKFELYEWAAYDKKRMALLGSWGEMAMRVVDISKGDFFRLLAVPPNDIDVAMGLWTTFIPQPDDPDFDPQRDPCTLEKLKDLTLLLKSFHRPQRRPLPRGRSTAIFIAYMKFSLIVKTYGLSKYVTNVGKP